MVLYWDIASSSRVRYGFEKNYQEEWKIIMIINRAEEFSS